MSGISTGVGIFSGIDTRQLIEQLLAIQSRPKAMAQQRITQLQIRQSGYLDINARIQSLQSAASAFRTENTFRTMRAVSSEPDVLTASASHRAAPGSYSFIVDRMVSTQQVLSRGFADANVSGLGAESFTFERTEARLDRNTALADLNGGAGIQRGKLVIAETGSGTAVTIDLSRAANVNDVVEAVNTGAASINVKARVEGGRFVLTHGGGQEFTVSEFADRTTAQSLGLLGSSSSGTLQGEDIYYMSSSTPLTALNDGNGVAVDRTTIGQNRHDFRILVGGQAVQVNIGSVYNAELEEIEPPASTLGAVVKRINDAMVKAGQEDVSVAISEDGTRLVLTDAQGRDLEVVENENTAGRTARDLGLATSGTVSGGTHQGQRILAGLNGTLARNLLGGSGNLGDGQIAVTARDGSVHALSLDLDSSVQDIMRQIADQTGGKLTATLNKTGNGLLVRDTTGGSGDLVITGTGGADTAEALGISTGPDGVASDTAGGASLQHAWITAATRLSSLNDGRGLGTGRFRVTDPSGSQFQVNVGESAVTLADLIREFNSQAESAGVSVRARINDNGDGLLLYDTGPGEGQPIRVEDVTGSVARNLKIAGEAKGTGEDNFIDGTHEVRVELDPSDTLEQIARKINEAGAGVSATIINDGNGSTPFRLNLTSTGSGTKGRFILDSGGFDLGLSTLDRGRDAVVFFGGTDPASAVLLTSSSNSLDGVVQGVSIDLKRTSANPVELTVARDNEQIEKKVEAFVDAFNEVITRIDFQTRFDQETQTRGPLLGDGTAIGMRNSLFSAVLGPAMNVSGPFSRLTDVGVSVAPGGKLNLDRERLRQAIEQDAAGVESLFVQRDLKPKGPRPVDPSNPNITVRDPDPPDEFNALGIAARLEEMAKQYINSIDGVLTLRNRGLDEQISLQGRRIQQIERQLATRRTALERQFIAMEQAIAQLQTQQSALGSIQMIG